PGKHLQLSRRELLAGISFGVLAALGQSFGAVLSRKAYEVARRAGENIDGIAAAYQRILGGLLVSLICYLVLKRLGMFSSGKNSVDSGERETAKAAWPWIVVNALAGPVLGVSCYQWALKALPTGVVLPIVAVTPIVIIPF